MTDLKVDHDPPRWVYERQADGTIARRYEGPLGTVLLASAADLLVAWWPQLRRCEHEECAALFLPDHGRQHYHVPACRQAAYRNRNKRDYSEEHEERVRRESGNPNLKTRKRTKTKQKGGKKR